jgi:hypothetical protein
MPLRLLQRHDTNIICIDDFNATILLPSPPRILEVFKLRQSQELNLYGRLTMKFVANSKTEDKKPICDLIDIEGVIVLTTSQDSPPAMSFVVDDHYSILRSPERWHELWEFYIYD